MNRKLIKDIEFQVGVRFNHKDGLIKSFSAYDVLRMACYPITREDGKEEKILQIHISYDGSIHDICEQRQMVLNSLDVIDLNLCRYYCELIGSAIHDIDESEKDEWKVVTMKIEAFEKIKD